MRAAYDVSTVRAAERALMATLPDGTLMGRAADGLARTCAGLLGQVYGSRVVLLVGSGDNGGDALLAGARLAARGARVDAVLMGERSHAVGLTALRRAGGRAVSVADEASNLELVGHADLVVDGIVGIGGRGALGEQAARLADGATSSGTWRVAVDLPSGVDADTGHVDGAAFAADVTVTFGCLKPGLLIAPGQSRAGIVELVDIGLEPWLGSEPSLRALEVVDVAAAWPQPDPADDKYTRGVVGVVAGSAEYTGAAVLCVGAALKAGAGMVRFVGADEATAAVRSRWPEAVTAPGRVQAWVVGPGLGDGPEVVRHLSDALASDVPVLVDADALSALAQHQDLVRGRTALTVLTPHDREFERFGTQIGEDRLDAARGLAADLGVTVLLKGATTVVAQPDGTAHVNPTGTAWLATAGTGDVLSGITGTLLAAGLGPMAPVQGAFVHGLAGRLASEGGPITAMDVVTAVPAALAGILPARGRIAG